MNPPLRQGMKDKLTQLIVDTMNGRFGTKNRSELISRLQGIYLEKSINPLRVNTYNRLVAKQLKDLADKVNELAERLNEKIQS